MNTSWRSDCDVHEAVFTIHHTLKDDEVPSFAVEEVSVELMRGYNWDVTTIYRTTTLWIPPFMLKNINNVLDFISFKPLDGFGHQYMYNFPAYFLNNTAHRCSRDSKKVAYGTVSDICSKMPCLFSTDIGSLIIVRFFLM